MNERDDNELNEADEAFARRVTSALDTPLDNETLARLRAAREEAVYAAGQAGAQRRRWLTAVPAGGAMAAGIALFVMMGSPAIQPLPALDEVELAAAADIELLESLELLAWLDDEVMDEG